MKKEKTISPQLERCLASLLVDIESGNQLSPPISSKEDLKTFLENGWDDDETA